MARFSSKLSFKSIMLLSASALILAGCASAPDASDGASGDGDSNNNAGSDYKACMVSDAGGFQDNSFNESSYTGLKQAEKNLGVQVSQAESRDSTDYQSNIDSLVAEGCNMVINVGFLLADATQDAAKQYPDVDFVLIDATMQDENFEPVTLPNVKSIVYDTAPAAFLAGYVAAGMTETGVLGTYGGMEIPTVTIFMDGFVDGVAYYNEQNGTSVKVLGWDKEKQSGTIVGSFEDTLAGQNITESLISNNADIIFPVAGPVGHGSVAAVESSGKDIPIIWVDADGYLTVPDSKSLFLTSVLKLMTEAVEDVIKEGMEGNFSNESYIGTLENGGVGIAPFHDYEDKVSAEIKDALKQIEEDIISGSLKVESPAQSIL